MLIPSLIHVMWHACISVQHDPGPSALLSFNHDSSLLIRIHQNAVVLVRTQGRRTESDWGFLSKQDTISLYCNK